MALVADCTAARSSLRHISGSGERCCLPALTRFAD